MEGEMRDYVVSYVFDADDYSCYHHIHFVSGYPLNSVGWWEDFYDSLFNLLESYDMCNLRIVEIAEGF